MRAVVVTEFGEPGRLTFGELPVPEPAPGQVTIDVAYAGVNFAEVMARRGLLPAFSVPFVPGLEVSGRVRALGDGVTGLTVGEPVAALTTRGGYAEVAVAPATLTFPLRPDDDSALQLGAALPTIVPTAWATVHEVGRLHPQEDIVIHAAAGGVGMVAGQVARLAGARRVLGVVGTPDKASYARQFGYDDVWHSADWAERVLDVTGRAGADVILDSVGGAVRERSLELLTPLGRLVMFGNASGAPETGFAGNVLRTANRATLGWSVTGLAATDPARLRAITETALAAVMDGSIKVDITEVYPLDRVRAAHQLLESRRTTGKLVIAITAPC